MSQFKTMGQFTRMFRNAEYVFAAMVFIGSGCASERIQDRAIQPMGENVRVVERRSAPATAPAVMDDRGVIRTAPLNRSIYLNEAEQTFEGLQNRATKLKQKLSEKAGRPSVDFVRIARRLDDAKADIKLLRIANDSAWERYQVRLDGTFKDIRDSLSRAFAE